MDSLEILHAALDAGDMQTAALAVLTLPSARKLPRSIISDLFAIGLKDATTANDRRKVRVVANACEARHV